MSSDSGSDTAGRGRLTAWLIFVAVFATIGYAGRFADGGPQEDVLYTYSAAIAGTVQYAVILGIVLLIARGRARELLALRRPTSWGRALRVALVVFIGIFVLGALLEPLLDPGKEQGLIPEDWDPDRAAAFALNFAVVALVAPIVEELTFRGLGYSLLERFGRWIAIVLVGLTFALAHGLVEALPLLAVFGAGLAYLRAATASVVPGIIVHAVFNGLVLLVAVTA